jgi:predicted PurR-regulated permease PerM
VIILVAFTIGMVFWITAWSFGVKSFDAFMVLALLTVIAATIRLVGPFVNQLLGREAPAPDQLGPGSP